MKPKAKRMPAYDELIRRAAVDKAWEGFGPNPWDTIDLILERFEVNVERVLADIKAVEREAENKVHTLKAAAVDRWIKNGVV